MGQADVSISIQVRMRWIKRQKKRAVRFKTYFDRARMYIGYGQFFLILLVFFESYKDTAFGLWFYKYSYVTLPGFVILFVVFAVILGYFDKKYIRGDEQAEIFKNNPISMDMYQKIDELHRKEFKDKEE